MGRINSSIGLITGLPIQDTVDKLVALQGRPRDLLVKQNQGIEKQKTALTQLTALVIGLQFSARRLSAPTIYNSRSVTSSDPSILAANSTGTPQSGSYDFTPLQLAQSQQFQSARLASKTAPLGAGSFSLRFGGTVDRAIGLDFLNGGEGFVYGKIRITDRSAASAEIDLSAAQTIDDVLRAINGNGTINVSAAVHGDRIFLTDETGLALSNLRVQEVDGTTAASLGLASIDIAEASAGGKDVLRLFDDLALAELNGRTGVRASDTLPDFQISLRDGSSVTVDLRRLAVPGTKVRGTTTAAAGSSARLEFTAVQAGSAAEGTSVLFVDDAGVSVGQESVSYDAQAKTLAFHVAAGESTANDVIAALARNSQAAALFTVARAAGSEGTGLVSTADTAVLEGPRATALSPAGAASDARIAFTAVHGGASFDSVEIRFENNDNIVAGQEQVSFDGQHLVFQVDEGNTTANNVIAALNGDPLASSFFSAASASGSSGEGLVQTSDTAFTSGGAPVEPVAATNETTLGQVLAAINAAGQGKLVAQFGGDSDRIVLTDLTADQGGMFAVESLHGSQAAADLGILATASGNVLAGGRLLGGLKTSLLRNLNGGAGIDGLGFLSITDRSGATANVDLTSTENIDEVIDRIKQAGIGVTARVNSSRSGIELVDTTGSTVSNLIVANGDGQTQTADRLGLAVNAAVSSKSSGSLRLATVNENTTLASLNGGRGVSAGSFTIFDTLGASKTVQIDNGVTTVGDLLGRIADLGLAVDARINEAGDGIELVDTANGTSALRVSEAGGAAAHDLHLLGTPKTITVDGQARFAIDGSTSFTIELDADDSLQDLASRIEALGAPVRATVLSDGSSVKPFRLTIASQTSGRAGEFTIDSTIPGLTLTEAVRAQDALLLVGSPGGGGSVASSPTNTFDGLVGDVSLTLKATSSEPVTVNVAATNDSLVSAVQDFVDAHNRLRSKLAELTAFNSETNESAVLQADGSALRVETDLASLIGGRVFSTGPFQSLETLGIRLRDDGTLDLDRDRLESRLSTNPTAVRDFLSKENVGLASRVDKLAEQLAGVGNSLLINRTDALDRKLQSNGQRVEFLNARLDAVRARLLRQFQLSETAIAKLQSNLTAIGSIAPLAPLNLSSARTG